MTVAATVWLHSRYNTDEWGEAIQSCEPFTPTAPSRPCGRNKNWKQLHHRIQRRSTTYCIAFKLACKLAENTTLMKLHSSERRMTNQVIYKHLFLEFTDGNFDKCTWNTRLTDSTLMRRGASNKHAISLPPAELSWRQLRPQSDCERLFQRDWAYFKRFSLTLRSTLQTVFLHLHGFTY